MDEESEPDVPSNDIHSGISAGIDDTFQGASQASPSFYDSPTIMTKS